MGPRSVSIVIADRQPVVLYGLLAMLHSEGDFNVVASCCDAATCIKSIRDFSPDLALLDISPPSPIGFEVLETVKVEQLSTRVVYLSPSCCDSRDVPGAIANGAYGVIPKESAPQRLLRGLRQVASGLRLLSPPEWPHGPGKLAQGEPGRLSTTLTRREYEIMQLVCAGLSNKEIGRELNLSDGTIKIHLHHIFQKLSIHNRTALACLAASISTEH